MQGEQLAKLSDADLLDRYIEGRDKRAFACLVQRYSELVMAAARRVTRSTEDAEDAFQATFFTLAKTAERIRARAALPAWLHRTTVRCAISVLRQNNRWNEQVRVMSDSIDKQRLATDERDPADQAVRNEINAVLDQEIDKLPTTFRRAMVLCDLQGLTRNEVSERLGIPVATVTYRVNQARNLLRGRISRRGVTLSAGALAGCLNSSTNTEASVTQRLVDETTNEALRYVAGDASGEAGISPTVIEATREVISTMNRSKYVILGLTSLVVVLTVGAVSSSLSLSESTARAGYIFRESFDDGDFADGDPVTWTPLPTAEGDYDASSGDLILGIDGGTDDNGSIPELQVRDNLPANTSTRAVVRLNSNNWGAGIVARGQDEGEFLGYVASVNHFSQGSILGVGMENAAGNAVVLSIVNLPFDARRVDTAIQLDVFDDEIKAWAWPIEEPKDLEFMPEDPTIFVFDTSITHAGFSQLNITRNPAAFQNNGQVVFRQFDVADMPIHEIVPEPSAGSLGLLSILVLMLSRWRYRD